ncbi:hypothetical protein PGT21_015786 [Puccinia graminis f. sp. tritici]|uniref:Uncharacterized protein n=2 Tax=Puccinia graminis f. sp. tritici TaxID=56615 RepID=A0A5B0NUF1_PUCGR|nr:hypothetical protein PGT21_015786 [Puccinia graminis f. sp. tritici]
MRISTGMAKTFPQSNFESMNNTATNNSNEVGNLVPTQNHHPTPSQTNKDKEQMQQQSNEPDKSEDF